MTTLRCECNGNATTLSNPKCILRDGHWITAASSAAPGVYSSPIVTQSLEEAEEEVAKNWPRTQGKDTFHAEVDRSVSEERPTSWIFRRTAHDRKS